ncbi:hypothetical protein [Streptomyces sp. BRA346]|uniref:hypothetical protein n=1 Tax=Streptomyces sp. BRA346 TaxID=2878199 RepID=UPI0040631D5F
MRNDHGMFRYAFLVTTSAVADAPKAAITSSGAAAAVFAAAAAVTADHLDGARS